MATRCEDAARGYDKRIENSEGATVTTHRGMRVYANSHGFSGGYESTSHSITCSVIGKSGESMQRDYWYSYGARRAASWNRPRPWAAKQRSAPWRVWARGA